jgi:mRNA interferase RelE/StbE
VAAYRLLIKPSAGKELSRLGSRADRQRIVQRIEALAENPRPHGAEKLAGRGDRYRIRQGNFRVVYLIDDHRHELTIFKVGDRKDVRKWVV